jgi:hypothetical protein
MHARTPSAIGKHPGPNVGVHRRAKRVRYNPGLGLAPTLGCGQDRDELRGDIHDNSLWNLADEHRPSSMPVRALDLIGKDHAGYCEASRDGNFERVSLDLARNRTGQEQPDLSIVGSRGQNDRRAPPRLLMAGLGIERKPYGVSPVGNVRHALPDFLPDGATPVDFLVQVRRLDAGKKLLKRVGLLRRGRYHESAPLNGKLDFPILFEPHLERERLWNPKGQAISPLLHPCPHKRLRGHIEATGFQQRGQA